MAIPKSVRIKNNKLPTTTGVYLFRDKTGRVIYVGKATNLQSRVSSYWKNADPTHSAILQNRRMGRTIEEMIDEVRRIDWITTDSVIEALILEANLIKKHLPKFNVKNKDDKSFLYVVITKEQWPKVLLVRGSEFAQCRHPERLPAQAGSEEPALSLPKGSRGSKDGILRSPRGSLRMTDGVMRVFGPYTSASAIRAALDLIRKWFPWSDCYKNIKRKEYKNNKKLRSTPYLLRTRACFDYHIGRCPGVCVGAISRREYMKNIRNVILMLEGKKAKVMKNLELRMKNASKEEKFEEAEALKRKLFALKHIRDVAVIAAESIGQRAKSVVQKNSKPYALSPTPIAIFGRIEGYDISNISGTSAVGAMVVFENGEPRKSEYKRFRIKTVRGINDVAMMREVLERRFSHSKELRAKSIEQKIPKPYALSPTPTWPLPDLIVVDGGWGQVNAAQEVIHELVTKRRVARLLVTEIPIVGIAKGFKRKQDRPVFDKNDPELARIVENYKDLLLRVRDEAHRFAVSYHRKKMRARIST